MLGVRSLKCGHFLTGVASSRTFPQKKIAHSWFRVIALCVCNLSICVAFLAPLIFLPQHPFGLCPPPPPLRLFEVCVCVRSVVEPEPDFLAGAGPGLLLFGLGVLWWHVKLHSELRLCHFV